MSQQEDQVLSTISWISTTGGDWSDGSNWQGGVVPDTADDAEMDFTAAETITILGTVHVHSLFFSDPASTFVLASSGALDVATDVILSAGTVALDGPIIAGGNVSITAETGIEFGPSVTIGALYAGLSVGTAQIVPAGTITATVALTTPSGTITVVPTAAACFRRWNRASAVDWPSPD